MAKKIFDFLKWLDPFTYVDLYVMPRVNPGKNPLIETIVYLVSAFVFAFVLYNFVLAGLLGTSAPLVIVYSGSMEPMLYRGDIVILSGYSHPAIEEVNVDYAVGSKPLREFATLIYSSESNGSSRASGVVIDGREYDFDSKGPVVVYFSQNRREDIIHRAALRVNAADGSYLVTFGDNNPVPDQDCPIDYIGSGACISDYLVPEKGVKGMRLFHIPLVGYVKLLLFDDLPRALGLGRR